MQSQVNFQKMTIWPKNRACRPERRERLERMRKLYGFLEREISSAALERSLSFTFNGVMLSWVMEAIETDDMLPAAGYGYALKLQGAATKTGRERLSKKVAAYQKSLTRAQRRAAA